MTDHNPKHRTLRFELVEERALLSATASLIANLATAPGALLSSGVTTGPNAPPVAKASSFTIPPAFYNHVATPVDYGGAGLNSPMSVTADLTPSQVRTAYGLNPPIMLGSVTGDGTGQTIAIVDAYQNTHITSDLATFDSTFGILAPPSFSVLNQSGGTDLSGVPADSGWAVEIALDVEWAHAMAPAASIVLFEANSNGNDLYTAVNTARGYANVSVVSMSWGGSEFFGETVTDSLYFTTPSGHTGVTFVASTGDNGSPGIYPAYSPNVVAVGGTTLNIANSSGAYSSEAGWSGSGGGTSTQESRPSYQNSLPSNTQREIPDVSFDADPNSGVLVYDAGWYNVGGTSLSAPCWGGIIAIVNQLRVSQGLSRLNSSSNQTQTQTLLYSLQSTDFHDVLTGSNGGFSCGPGYDEVTGRGSPVTSLLAVAMVQGDAPTTGEIHGTVYNDANDNGVRDAGETGQSGQTVFIDDNGNGTLDGGTSTVSTGNINLPLPDVTTTTSNLVVSGIAGVITDVNVTLNITHTYDSDLVVFLISPTGTRVALFANVGGSGHNFTNTTLDDQAATPIASGSAPFTGSYQPQTPLSAVNGQVANGTWTLEVTDDAAGDSGTLINWSMVIGAQERYMVTNSTGAYAFTSLPPATYTVREVQQTGWVETAPAAGYYSVVVAAGNVITGKDFGNYLDTTPPSVTINQAAGQADPTRSSPINFTVVFSESVADFVASDVSFAGSTALGTLLDTVTGNGTTYNVAVTGMTGSGSVVVSIPAGNVHDTAGNANTASTSTDNTVTFDNVSPAVTSSTPSTAGPTNATSLTFTVAFSEPVVNVSTTDFRLTATGTAAGTIASVSASSGTSFTVTINSIAGDGTLRLDLKSFTTVKDLAGNVAIGYSAGSTVTIDNTAPTVTEVLVASTAWQSAFLASLGGVGYAIPSGSNQVLSLPWGNLNEIIVQFSENVSVAQANMALVGVNVPNYTFAPSSFVYDSVAHRATWTVSQNLGVDKLLIDLDGSTAGAVADAAGNRLDGEWTNPTWAPPAAPVGGQAWPSGDGTPGGNFLFRFNVLPGDADQNGVVNFADLNVVLMHYNQTGDWTTGDFTGDGVTNFADLSTMLSDYNQTLPAAEPTPPSGSGFAAIASPLAQPAIAPQANVATASTATAVWDAALVDVSLQLKHAVSIRSEVAAIRR